MQNYHCSYVDSHDGLVLAVQELQQENLIAIDTEFCRKLTYFPILSTIQVACFSEGSPNNLPRIFIIDCLAISNLKPFLALLEDQKIIKVFHSALQDLQILLRASVLQNQGIESYSTATELCKSRLKAVFDTQIMANLCSSDFNIGYGNLVEKLFSQKLCKEHQMSDWQLRPLSQNQIRYAANDVLYLAKIFEYLHAKITSAHRNDWLAEEMESLIKRSNSGNLEGLLKKFDLANKTKKEVELLWQLVAWRENAAQKLDIPRQHLVRDDALEEIASKNALPQRLAARIDPESAQEILQILQSFSSDKNLTPNQYCQNHEGLILQGQDSQKTEKNADLLHSHKGDEESRRALSVSEAIAQKKSIQKLIAKIQNLVRSKAENCGISEQFLLSKSTIIKIIEQKNCRNFLAKWRYELLGNEIESIVSNHKT